MEKEESFADDNKLREVRTGCRKIVGRTAAVSEGLGYFRKETHSKMESKIDGLRIDMKESQTCGDGSQIDADVKIIASRINLMNLFHGSNVARVRDKLEKLPIKLTLGNLGIFALSLAATMPRAFTHIIVYPIFRLVFGTLYPAYASYKAVRTKNVKEYVKWMMYWIVFALFTCAETFTDVFLSFWFPFYYEIKIILVLWLLSPATKGSSILYRRFVHPALSRREAEIDEALARATEQGYTAVLHLGSRGVNYATTVLMQTAIKGGGGLVQQLKKSYSLSDLTGDKEDENRNTPDTRDEIDMQVEPRRRENVGRRGYSPRRTQSGSNRVDMYFSEVDVDVRQPRPREPVASLSNIRSSDDISSGYSSGEALHPSRANSQVEPLVRTSSVGARTRPKPRSTAKKAPEDSGEEASDIELPYYPRLPVPGSQAFLTPEQALEFLLAISLNNSTRGSAIDYSSLGGIESLIRVQRDFSQNARTPSSYFNQENDNDYLDHLNDRDEKSTSKESSPEFLDADQFFQEFARSDKILDTTIDTSIAKGGSVESVLLLKEQLEDNSKGFKASKLKSVSHETPESGLQSPSDSNKSDKNPEKKIDVEKLTSEICQSKFDELKSLISSAQKAVSSIISTEDSGKERPEEIGRSPDSKEEENRGCKYNSASSSSGANIGTNSLLGPPRTPVISRSNSDSFGDRAGKYNKKPAPKAPQESKSQEDLDDAGTTSRAFKARLVIKTGTVKTVTNVDTTKDVFLSHSPKPCKRKKSKAEKTRDGFSKLLTIPKSIFHTAFHHKDEDASSSNRSRASSRTGSRSRSVSSSSREEFVDANDRGASISGKDMDLESVLVKAALLDSKAETYIDLRSNSIDNYNSEDSKSEELQDRTVYERKEFEEKIKRSEESNREIRDGNKAAAGKNKIAIRQLSHSPTRATRRSFENIE